MDLRAENISKRYFRRTGEANNFMAVQPVSMTLRLGEITVLGGRSGSGKTTLLHMLSGLLTPTEGKVFLGETELYALPDAALSRLRNEKIAVIPQGRSAVETLTVLENILLPGILYAGTDRQDTARKWMEVFGIDHLEDTGTAELSGGELRRMAIARALTADPDFLFADEPTGDLDDENTRLILSTLRSYAHEEGKSVFLVTHEIEAEHYADRFLIMDAGRIHGE